MHRVDLATWRPLQMACNAGTSNRTLYCMMKHQARASSPLSASHQQDADLRYRYSLSADPNTKNDRQRDRRGSRLLTKGLANKQAHAMLLLFDEGARQTRHKSLC